MSPLVKLVACMAVAVALAGCGGTPAAEPEAAPPEPAVAVEPIAAAGVGAANGSVTFRLRGTTLLRFDEVRGQQTAAYDVGRGWRLAGVSSTGRWVGLTRGDTEILVLDGATGVRTHEVELRGRFTLETISKAGDFLFLQQDFDDGTYAVRGYDLARGRLAPGSLGTKGETVKMQGRAGQVLASPDGEWLLTLYVNTKTRAAFVHALNLVERLPLCIVLPPCTDCSEGELGGWALRLRPDGRTAVATNGALGRRAVLDLRSGEVVA